MLSFLPSQETLPCSVKPTSPSLKNMEGAFIPCMWQEQGAVFTSPKTEADSGNISFASFWDRHSSSHLYSTVIQKPTIFIKPQNDSFVLMF